MKKVLFLLGGLILYAGTVDARLPIVYRGEVALGYSVIPNRSISYFNFCAVHGIELGEYWSAGLGVGFDYGDEWNIPLYLNVKSFLPVSDFIFPYLSFDFGMGISDNDHSSVIYSPAIGVGIGRFIVQLGYNVQEELGALQIKTGFVF